MMNTQMLEYFMSFAQMRSVRKCAKKYNVYPSAVTAAIKKLSHEFNAELYTMDKNKINLTEDGVIVYKMAEEVLNNIWSLERNMLDGDENLQGALRLTAASGIVSFILPELFQNIYTIFPELDIFVRPLPAYEVLSSLEKGETDIGFVHWRSDESEEIFKPCKAEKLLSMQYAFMVNKQSEFCDKRSVKIADLKDMPIVLYKHSQINENPLLDILQDKNFKNIILTDNGSRVEYLISTQGGKYMTMVPFINGRLYYKALNVESMALILPDENICYDIAYVYADNNENKTVKNEVLDYLRRYAKKL